MKSFVDTYKTLNAGQKKAVDLIEGPVMVIAGPGTGKTQILTLRIVNILASSQVNPENILALTFTENAAAEMKERLSEYIGPDAFRVQINTFHGFCNELIQKNFDIFHHLASYLPISELEEIQIIEEILESEPFAYLRPSGDPTHFYQPIRQAIGSLKKEGIAPSTFLKAIAQWKDEFEKRDDLVNTKGRYKGKMKGFAMDEIKRIERSRELSHLYELYQIRMKEKKYYDFNDMIIEVIRALSTNEAFLAQVRETYQYILVDEHQDTNNAQNAIIEYLCAIDDFPNLFVVGDEKQSIFRFQGASLENFLYFQKTFPRATLVYLEENYRSTQRILDVSGSFIQHNTESISSGTKLKANAAHKDVVIEMNEYPTPATEWNEIIAKIKTLSTAGVLYEEMAVLLRKNDQILEFADLAAKNNIATYLSTEESIFADFHIKKIIRLLEAVYGAGSDAELARILLMNIFGGEPLAVFTALNGAHKKHLTLWEYLGTDDAPARLREIRNKLLMWKVRSENEPIDNFFIALLHESGLMNGLLQEPDSISLLGKVSVLYEDIKKLQRKNHALYLAEYVDYLHQLEEHGLSPASQVIQQKQNRVFVSTVHKAKGLEFTAVFIPQMNDGTWGGQRGRQNLLSIPWKYLSRVQVKDESELVKIEEERRLFYVALTRAKKHVFLSRSIADEEGKTVLASRFLFELPAKEIKSTTKKEDFEEAKNRLLSELAPLKNDHEWFDKKELQEYFSYTFNHSGVSVSALNNYLSCPWKYVFRNLIHLPDVRGFYLLFGTAIHETIQEYIVALRKNKVLGVPELLQSYNEIVDNFSASENDIRLIKERGAIIIPAFYEKQMKEWDGNRESEVVIPNLLLAKDLLINGKIDMIEYKKDREVAIYDFKTGKVKSRNEILGLTKKNNKDYYRQLVFYKLLLSLYKKGQYHMTEGTIEFVESAETGDIRKETFEISKEDVTELVETIKKMREAITTLSFWDQPCDDKTCEYCKLRQYFYRPLR